MRPRGGFVFSAAAKDGQCLRLRDESGVLLLLRYVNKFEAAERRKKRQIEKKADFGSRARNASVRLPPALDNKKCKARMNVEESNFL